MSSLTRSDFEALLWDYLCKQLYQPSNLLLADVQRVQGIPPLTDSEPDAFQVALDTVRNKVERAIFESARA